jgi:hypothetical protein
MDSANAAEEIGYQTVDISYARDNQRAAFTRKVLQTDTAERFVSVLVPRDPSDDLGALASSVSVVQDAAGFVGKTEVSLALAGEDAKTYVIDVLYEDDITSTVVYGELGSNMAIKSYDKQPQLRTAGALVFDAAELQVNYDASADNEVKSFEAKTAKQIVYEGVTLLDCGTAVAADINYEIGEVSGVIDAAEGLTVKIYAPVECVNLVDTEGLPIIGSYDPVSMSYEFVTGVNDCQSIIDGGLRLDVDISGPEGEPDCMVDIWDFMEFSKYWLESVI